MGIERYHFGEVDNKEVYSFTITDTAGISVKVMNLGCHILEINVPNREGKFSDIVLSFDNFEAARDQTSNFGVVVGRYANRIRKGELSLNGKTYRLYANDGQNHLHGGKYGFAQKVWDAEIYKDRNAVRFHYFSPDGEENYPGNLNAYVTYTLKGESFVIEYEAVTDADTIVNLTNHSYFNLAGHDSGTILDHYLKLNCSKFTECDSELIPTGIILDVEGTPFDFREYRRIGDRIDVADQQIYYGHGYDHNFMIDRKGAGIVLAASLWDKKSGRIMEVYTDKPGIQFYSGNFLHGADIGKGGCAYKKRSGLCLETQFFPDSINHPNFKSPVLKPGDTYRYSTAFRFLTDNCK